MAQALQRTDAITTLIPAAGRVPEGVVALSNVTSPAMIPVAGRPVIHWTLSYLRSLGLRRFRIAVAERGLFVEEYVSCVFGEGAEIEFVVPVADRGLGSTVRELAAGVRTPSALVVLGDTHFEFASCELLDDDHPVVLVDEVAESYRWCVVDTDDQGVVTALRDKEPGLPPPLSALVGVYFFPDAESLRAAADEASARPGRVEMSSILGLVGDATPVRTARAGMWLDCGNPDTQASSQRVLLAQRAFNELSVDPVFGTITKRSRNVEKFIDEINYLRLLPPELAVLFPRVLESSTDWDDPHVTLEFYGYPTLAELFVLENVDAGIWSRIFAHLRDIIVEGFMHRRRPIPAHHVHEMYLGKVARRLGELDGPPELRRLIEHQGDVVVNGVALPNLLLLWDALEERVSKLAASTEGSVIHGDLCFSNILYDLRSGICKLIDPRGSFGNAGIFGDPRYDLAKLYHSVYGLYDFLTADLFDVAVDGTEVALRFRTRPQHDAIRAAFDAQFFPLFDHREVLLVTGLLFASMPPLHFDHPARQVAMYARGLQVLAEALDVSPTGS